MSDYLQGYLSILIFMAIAFGLAFILVVLPFITNRAKSYSDKVSAYECGFEAFASPRSRFDIRFYLVAILFVIFDLEIAFLFPWAISLKAIGMYGFISMMIFLVVLAVGFIYEWKSGALEWE
ncbi:MULTISPECIES: NADH-quinone oxidoreductase subunit A [unclassified Candidatus Lariskella]|uniref:NADH-quinone oxidoreductase subunit A n=1 Tax=unclassified Candidatus Lariskella TaxID=2632605 RepID=UPI0030CFFAAF